MKTRIFLFSLLVLVSFLTKAQTVYTVETVPDPMQQNSYVSDPDSILDASSIEALNKHIRALEDSSTAQIAVVILNSIGEESPKDFATRLFNYWGIGQAGKDNGLLIFTVMDQRRTEFETGYGLEGVLPDVLCYRIGMQSLVPFFKEGRYGDGLVNVVSSFREVLENPENVEEIRDERRETRTYEPPSFVEEHWYSLPPFVRETYIPINILFHVILFLVVFFNLRSKQDLYDKYMGIRWFRGYFYLVIFPIPYIPVYFYLDKILRKLRHGERYSKVNGMKLHMLSEEEENKFLNSGQITEEEIGSVDYDVWSTEDHTDTLILRYSQFFSKYRNCPSCGFKTYYKEYSRTIVAPTYTSSGKGERKYSCKNCSYSKVETYTIPKKTKSKSRSSSSGSSSSWSSSSSSSSSWGGGSSGGGGSGVSW